MGLKPVAKPNNPEKYSNPKSVVTNLMLIIGVLASRFGIISAHACKILPLRKLSQPI